MAPPINGPDELLPIVLLLAVVWIISIFMIIWITRE
jgi:hypothetical protein